MCNYVALCACGAEKVLGNELKRMGCRIINRGGEAGRVLFSGGDDIMYRANMALRTSDKVFLCLASYKAHTFDDLFEGCRGVNWQDLFHKDVRVVVDKVRSRKSALNSEHTVQSVVQKAIYTKLGEVWHMTNLPESGDKVNVRVYLDNDETLLLLDTSGEPLYKRGYRRQVGPAPLRESLAAVCLFELLWRRRLPLRDPFCGSGTIVIEAFLYAHDIAPGLARDFAYKHLSIYSADAEKKIKTELANNVRYDVSCDIAGSDIESGAVRGAKEIARKACAMYGAALERTGAHEKLVPPEFFESDFRGLRADTSSGCILSNPPYGEQLGDEEEALYEALPVLKDNFPGWDMGFLTRVPSFEEHFGTTASITKGLKAGSLDTTLYIYKKAITKRREP